MDAYGFLAINCPSGRGRGLTANMGVSKSCVHVSTGNVLILGIILDGKAG